MSALIQPMPELTEEQYAALRADIETNGVLVPIVKDQHGRTIDGNNREAIAAELGIECPVVVREVVDDGDAWELALTLNCARRHLTHEQKRQIIRAELLRCEWRDSDRAIGKRVGCDHKTVGAVRVQMKLEAEESTRKGREAMKAGFREMWTLVHDLLLEGFSLDTAAAMAEKARDDLAPLATEVLRDGTKQGTVAGLPVLVDWWVYSGLATELHLLRTELIAAGWSQDSMPEPGEDVMARMESLFPTIVSRVGNLPTLRERLEAAR